jgi:AcrR family transcriptional regulator
MVELVGEQGYAETTVAHVIERASASRRTFYAEFSDREDCFLQASEEIAHRWIEQASTAVERSRGGRPVESFVTEIFNCTLSNPSAVRLLAVELPAAGRRGIECRESVFEKLGGILARALAAETGGEARGLDGDGPFHCLVSETLAGAIVRVPLARALRGERVRRPRRGALLALVPDVAAWATTYASAPPPEDMASGKDLPPLPVGGRAPGTLSLTGAAEERLGLPQRESNPSRSFVVHSQRERLLDALANLSARKGYQAVTIPEIVAEARVSVQTFYEHFDGREDMLAVAYEIGRRKLMAMVERAYRTQDDWTARVRAALSALISFLASEPSFAHLALVDVPAAGGKIASMPHREGALFYTELLKPGLEHANGRRLPQIAAEAGARALHELCYSTVATREAPELLKLNEMATYLALAPFTACVL